MFGRTVRSLVIAGLLSLAGTAHAAIPLSERAALLDLYASTNGGGWTASYQGWGDPAGTECSWNEVTCDAGGNTVTRLWLSSSHLTGTLPASLNNLTNLIDFEVYSNAITGSIPALSLTHLTTFDVSNNQFTGAIPTLTGLPSLVTFDVHYNSITGSIPSLTGLTNLATFDVSTNAITGSIPSLAGLTNLVNFYAYYNQLTGSIPALAGLTKLVNFEVDDNLLTGAIPSLTGLTSLDTLTVYNNALTGAIPSLTGLTSLRFFRFDNNQLTGITSLAGLAKLTYFRGENNQLTGPIPSLAGLTSLSVFYIPNNNLTGSIPPLTGLMNMDVFVVNNNHLTGNVPSVPIPNTLNPFQSHLCPNYLNHTPDPAWDTATGQTPWYTLCTAAPPPTKLSVASVNGGANPIAGVAFNVVVEAQDGTGIAANVAVNTTLGLSLSTGTGTLGGTLACTIMSGSNACTVFGATYSKAETGVIITATRTSGDALAPGNSAPFDVTVGGLPPVFQNAASRKVHGGIGTFNLQLSP